MNGLSEETETLLALAYAAIHGDETDANALRCASAHATEEALEYVAWIWTTDHEIGERVPLPSPLDTILKEYIR